MAKKPEPKTIKTASVVELAFDAQNCYEVIMSQQAKLRAINIELQQRKEKENDKET